MIAIEEVSKRYADGTVAVDRLSLEIPNHSITVLVGPSGCGKTTTLRMINRMVEPSSGTIRVNGEDVQRQPVNALRRSMGYVIQNAGLFQHRTIIDNIATVPRLLGWSKHRARARAAELMERVGLDKDMARRYPYQLSGGQQQRVGVARALAADPPILLMDEPFSAVDPVVRRGLQEELLRIQGELGKAIVFVTHDMDEAITIGDRIAVLRTGGRLAQFAAPDELLSSPADEFVEEFLGGDRGIRGLSFLSTRDLALDRSRVFPISTDRQRIAEAAGSQPAYAQPVLVTDADGKPLGWTDPAAWDGDAVTLTPYGQSFEIGRDSLRVALDRAVLSPTGHAVAVDGSGRVLGIAGQETIAAAIRAARRQHAAGSSGSARGTDSPQDPPPVKATR
ncbi:ABC transporter ATP-binding protein [Streptomyces xiangluensis]|uniref:ABC transporter ATP-binding protein n=1 Tax=Streptomyces xiangluensis TaxID=2665720 RepID=A0ABV8Z0Q8_9ACTN